MLANSNVSDKKPAAKKIQRKKSKVFDPCVSNKKKKNSDELTCSVSDENNSVLANNQFNLFKNQVTDKTDLNKTVEDLCAKLGFTEYVSADDLSDDSVSECPVIPRNNSIESCLDKMFEGLDGYAAFNPLLMPGSTPKGSTPKEQRNGFSAIDPSIRPTPGLSSTNRPKSILKSRNENVAYTTPTSSGSFKLNRSSQSNTSVRTPLSDQTNLLQTPASSINSIDKIITSPLRFTPASSCLPASFYTPRATPKSGRKPLSPGIIEVSPETKRTILAGIPFFVDVKTNKEDCSSSVALELLSMGASVEKTFNKKVTHVVFKEGRPSTYLKAKKLGVPMVSVLWIEACKKERKVVDPGLHPPICMEKYETMSPSERKIPSIKTIQRKLRRHFLWEAGQTVDSKTRARVNWRKAVTEIKASRQNSCKENSQGKICTKKLDFLSAELKNPDAPDANGDNRAEESVLIISDTTDPKINDENKDSSHSSSDIQVSPCLERRLSAPGRFVPERKKRKRKEEVEPVVESQKLVTIDKLFAKQMTLNENKKTKQCNIDIGSQSSQVRRRKLLNTNEDIICLDTPDGKQTPPPINFDYKLLDCSDVNKKQTKSTSVRKIFKKVASKKPVAKKSLTSLLEQDESCGNSSRNSLSYFIESKKTEAKVKDPPTIVCTSLLPEEVRKVAYIVGKLGTFDIEDKVSSKTTHVVTSAPRRTVNLLKALVRGCWILHLDWVLKSETADHWLNEEEFELKCFSEAVTEMRRERQAFGPAFCCELFSTCGTIYISRRSVPSHNDLTELVKLCKGRVVNSSSSADYIVGGKILEGETAPRIKEKWILDSITQNTLLETERYLIKADKN